ncbi:hypothetical protein [Myceligenerans crystallogenes]|uniref:DUF222 domain-containing protein n=1 Tax=Myceligenerans crystallogenes TaxID=316335 RepID=A0ABN2NM38_9MICO
MNTLNATVTYPHDPKPPFAYPQGLRRVLVQILKLGADGWSRHPQVPDLLAYCESKYALLARRHGQETTDAVAAAFDVLRLPSTLDADDPWGVVTRAVQRTLQAADRADRLLCSTDHARRLMKSGDRDAERFSELDEDAAVPALVERIAARTTDESATQGATARKFGSIRESITDRDARIGLITVRTLMSWAGWPPEEARVALEYVCHRLRESGGPGAALDALRRDLTPLRLLDVDHRTWTRLCRTLLGDAGTDGLLRRAVCGARPVDLLADARLTTALALTAPVKEARRA